MKNKMILITVFLLIAFAILLPVFIVTKNAIVEAVTVTVGITFYHFAMRLAVGTVVNFIMKNKANYKKTSNFGKNCRGIQGTAKLYALLRERRRKTHTSVSDHRVLQTVFGRGKSGASACGGCGAGPYLFSDPRRSSLYG